MTILKMAGPAGLEPVTSGVTGRRSNQLNYGPAIDDLLNDSTLAFKKIGGRRLERLTFPV